MMNDSQGDFTVDDVSPGAHAHGFGTTADGRNFAFRVRGKTLHLEVYRADMVDAVPSSTDLEAVAETDVTDVDLCDERSIVAAVRDLAPTARPVDPTHSPDTTLIRSLWGRLGGS